MIRSAQRDRRTGVCRAGVRAIGGRVSHLAVAHARPHDDPTVPFKESQRLSHGQGQKVFRSGCGLQPLFARGTKARSQLDPESGEWRFDITDNGVRRIGGETARAVAADTPWSVPLDLGSGINDMVGDETRPSLSWDGTTLYFGSNRPGVEGGSDIFVTTRQRLTDGGK